MIAIPTFKMDDLKREHLRESVAEAQKLIPKLGGVVRRLRAVSMLLMMRRDTARSRVAQTTRSFREALTSFEDQSLHTIEKIFQEKVSYVTMYQETVKDDIQNLKTLCEDAELLLKHTDDSTSLSLKEQAASVHAAFSMMLSNSCVEVELDDDIDCLEFVQCLQPNKLSALGKIICSYNDQTFPDEQTDFTSDMCSIESSTVCEKPVVQPDEKICKIPLMDKNLQTDESEMSSSSEEIVPKNDVLSCHEKAVQTKILVSSDLQYIKRSKLCQTEIVGCSCKCSKPSVHSRAAKNPNSRYLRSQLKSAGLMKNGEYTNAFRPDDSNILSNGKDFEEFENLDNNRVFAVAKLHSPFKNRSSKSPKTKQSPFKNRSSKSPQKDRGNIKSPSFPMGKIENSPQKHKNQEVPISKKEFNLERRYKLTGKRLKNLGKPDQMMEEVWDSSDEDILSAAVEENELDTGPLPEFTAASFASIVKTKVISGDNREQHQSKNEVLSDGIITISSSLTSTKMGQEWDTEMVKADNYEESQSDMPVEVSKEQKQLCDLSEEEILRVATWKKLDIPQVTDSWTSKQHSQIHIPRVPYIDDREEEQKSQSNRMPHKKELLQEHQNADGENTDLENKTSNGNNKAAGQMKSNLLMVSVSLSSDSGMSLDQTVTSDSSVNICRTAEEETDQKTSQISWTSINNTVTSSSLPLNSGITAITNSRPSSALHPYMCTVKSSRTVPTTNNAQQVLGSVIQPGFAALQPVSQFGPQSYTFQPLAYVYQALRNGPPSSSGTLQLQNSTMPHLSSVAQLQCRMPFHTLQNSVSQSQALPQLQNNIFQPPKGLQPQTSWFQPQNLSQVQSSANHLRNSMSPLQTSAPQSQDSVSQLQTSVNLPQNSTSPLQTSVSRPQSNVSPQQTSVSPQQTSVSQSPGSMSHLQSNISQLQSIMSQSHNSMLQPDNIISRPDNIISQPDSVLSQPDNILSQPDGIMSQPQCSMSQSKTIMSLPLGSVSQPQSNAIQSDDGSKDTAQPQITSSPVGSLGKPTKQSLPAITNNLQESDFSDCVGTTKTAVHTEDNLKNKKDNLKDKTTSKRASNGIAVKTTLQPGHIINNNTAVQKNHSQETLQDNQPFSVSKYRNSCSRGLAAKLLVKFGSHGRGMNSMLHFPIGVTTGTKEDIIVTDTGNHVIRVFDRDGNFKFSFGENLVPSLKRPSAVVVTTCGEIFVKDDVCIHKFTPKGKFICRLGARKFHMPYGLALTSKEDLVTLDVCEGDSRVFIISPDGQYGNSYRFEPLINGCYGSKCRFMAIYNDLLYISDLGRDCVYVTDLFGQMLCTIGHRGRRLGDFSQPAGLSLDKDGYIIVADSKNERVQIFFPDGQFMCAVNFSEAIVRPSDIHLTTDGRLIVVNYTGHEVKVYKLGIQ